MPSNSGIFLFNIPQHKKFKRVVVYGNCLFSIKKMKKLGLFFFHTHTHTTHTYTTHSQSFSPFLIKDPLIQLWKSGQRGG